MKNVLIVFADPQLPYSPTTLNLFYELKKEFKVQIISAQPMAFFSLQKVDDRDIIYFDEAEEPNNETEIQKRNPNLLERGINKIKRRGHKSAPTALELQIKSLTNTKAKKVIELIKDFEGEIIAVDFFALWCAQQAGKKAHLLSLEIHEYDAYKDACDFSFIKSIIIQSTERYKYLFGESYYKHFFIQNAPPYFSFEPSYASRNQRDLVYCGSAMPWFGIVSCLDFIKDYPEYYLTIKGAIPKATHNTIDLFYNDLILEGRLILDKDFLDAVSLTKYVSNFRIGFAFYDFYRFENVRAFNYYTAPSGKVFQYLNSGVPVIANRLPGFELIEQKNAGVLISHLGSSAIKSAIDKIESEYEQVSGNAKKASKDFDFIKNVAPFIQYLKSSES